MTNKYYAYAGVVVVMVILGVLLYGRDVEQGGKSIRDILGGPQATSTETTNNTQGTPAPSQQVTPKPSSPLNGSKQTILPQPPPQAPTPSIPTQSELDGLIFSLKMYNGNAVAGGEKYTLSFSGNGMMNAKLCNSLSGNFVLDGSLLKVNNLVGTKMYCGMPTNLMQIENDFVSMLNFGARIYRSGDTLIISHAQGTVMVFTGF